jgi:ABC-type uncharacterized transport system ATPase subunit
VLFRSFTTLTESARRLPDKVALVCQGKRITYGEIDAQSNALADRVVIVFADNTLENSCSSPGQQVKCRFQSAHQG